MCGMELGFGGIYLRLSGLLPLRRNIEIGPRRPSLRQKRLLALKMIARLRQLPLGGREACLRLPQCVQLVLRFESATICPACTRSPSLPLFSSSRPEIRNAKLTSSSASIRPVNVSGWPASRFSTVMVRTGRGVGAAVSVSFWQPASGKAGASATSAISSVQFNFIWPERSGMTRPSMTAADLSLQIFLAKFDLRNPRLSVKAPQVASEMHAAHFLPGANPPVSANVLSGRMEYRSETLPSKSTRQLSSSR